MLATLSVSALPSAGNACLLAPRLPCFGALRSPFTLPVLTLNMKTYYIYTDSGRRFLGTIQSVSLSAALRSLEHTLIIPCTVSETPPADELLADCERMERGEA